MATSILDNLKKDECKAMVLWKVMDSGIKDRFKMA